MGEPATPQEAEALAKFREILPDDGLTRAWANLTFIDNNGRAAEVDVLLLTKVGFFLLELKGWHGVISGTAQRWYHAGRNEENPWLLADRKAKRLSSLLKSFATPAVARTFPFVRAVVVLHGNGSKVTVDEHGLANVVRLDGYAVKTKKPLPTVSQLIATPPGNPYHLIDGARARIVRNLCDKADFRKTPKTRMVGDFAVSETAPVAEGPDWQDVVVHVPAMPKVRRRLRLYDVPSKAPASERARIEQLAQREFQLTYGIKHDGIAVPTDIKTTDDGPALVFEYDDAETPLDAYLADHGKALTMEERVALILRLGEILRYAHQRHIVHRALAPGRVWVTPRKKGLPSLAIRDWYFGQKDRSTDGTSRWTDISGGVSDLLSVADHDTWVYLAPEARQNATDVPSMPLDVYGFGALAYLILTGTHPATSVAELQQLHADAGCLDPRRAAQGVPDDLADVIALATSVVESQRPASVDETLEFLRDAWDAVRRPAGADERRPAADPLEAQADDVVADRFIVTRRRGEGSTGVALAVQDPDGDEPERELVLKIARTDAAGKALASEAQVLRALNHRRVVRLVEGPLDIDGRQALLLSDAGPETLAGRLAKEGRATLQQLERFGSELLEAMSYLDTKGLFHRDIKPANLGIREDPGTRRPTLVLFDFSLASEPVENVRSGTSGYLDPYLGRGRRSVYDRAAELYAVSATLFEMATGQLPWWGEGAGAPTADEASVVEPSSFEPSVATALTAFFRKVLAPAVKGRYGTADELAAAWQEIFAALDLDDESAAQDAERAEQAALTTPLEQAGLSARALSALARLDAVATVGDLLGVHPVNINRIPGLGEKYRKEIQARIREWRARLSVTEEPGPDVSSGTERLVKNLLDKLEGQERTVAKAILGLPDGGAWPSTADVAQVTGMPRDQVTRVVDSVVSTWTSRRSKVLDGVRDDVLGILATQGRVMTVSELASALAAQRGSLLDGDERLRQGAALLRAVYELDARVADPALDLRRRTGGRSPVVALRETADPEGTGEDFPQSDALTELAIDLGRAANDLVRNGVVQHVTAVKALSDVLTEALGGTAHLDNRRLLRLAAAASDDAAVSGFDELYLRGLDPVTAADHALRGKPGRSISAIAIRKNVAARFPSVDLPSTQAALDKVVAQVIPGAVNRNGIYESPSSVRRSMTGTSLTTLASGGGSDDVSGRLLESFSRRSALTLCVEPKRYVRSTRLLQHGYEASHGLQVLDVGSLLVRATRELADAEEIEWPFVLGVDAMDHASADWGILASLVRQAVEPRWRDHLAEPAPLLITNAGPLVRYGMTSLLADLLDVGTRRPASRWLLTAKSADQPVPRLESHPVPVGPSGWITLPANLGALPAATPSPSAG
jgi:serine/threonine protein kinase